MIELKSSSLLTGVIPGKTNKRKTKEIKEIPRITGGKIGSGVSSH